MKGLELFYPTKADSIGDNLSLGILETGRITTKTIYIKNVIDKPVNVNIKVTGKDIRLLNAPTKIEAGETSAIDIEMNPPITANAPLDGNISIESNWVVD